MTLSTSHWVSVQDERSKILCGKIGALKITPNDCLHQEYLTINLGSIASHYIVKLFHSLVSWSSFKQFGGRWLGLPIRLVIKL